MNEDEREENSDDDEEEQLAMSLVLLMLLNHFKTITPDVETWNQIAEMIPTPEVGKSYLVGRLQIIHRVCEDGQEEGGERGEGEEESEEESQSHIDDTIEYFGDFVLRLEESSTWKKVVHWYADAPTSSTHYDINVLDLTQSRFLAGI